MIDWVLALLISDIRHSDLAHQGMTSNATYSTHPPLITFILIILSHFTPWPVFDVIRQSCLLWDDVSSNRSIKGQDKVQAVNISFCSSFCLLVLSKCSCSMRMLPFYRCKPCPAINSLNRVLFSSVILFGVFAPWVWLPILFSVAFSSVFGVYIWLRVSSERRCTLHSFSHNLVPWTTVALNGLLCNKATFLGGFFSLEAEVVILVDDPANGGGE